MSLDLCEMVWCSCRSGRHALSLVVVVVVVITVVSCNCYNLDNTRQTSIDNITIRYTEEICILGLIEIFILQVK